MVDLPFDNNQTWAQRVLRADDIWAQVEDALQQAGENLPETLRRPDVRLILDNVSGQQLQFLNPGDHSKGQPEIIPASGDNRAVMVMVAGQTLDEQMKNAHTLVERFELSAKGCSIDFAYALGTDKTEGLVTEAYGPAPYKGQADKLVSVDWGTEDGQHTTIEPVKGDVCSYGARAATSEKVFRSEIVIFVQGTGTVPEQVENEGMCIVVESDWQTGVVRTRPIVPSVARGFYGQHFDVMPKVTVNPEGYVQSIDLGNDKVINVAPPPVAEGQDLGITLQPQIDS